MQATAFEPMSIGQILDRTFRIYKSNFLRFITIVAIIQVPVSLLVVVSQSILQSGTSTYEATDYGQDGVETYDEYEGVNVAQMIIGGVGAIIAGIFAILGQKLCQGVLTKSVSEYYLGNEISVGQAYKSVMPKMWTLLGAGFLVGLVVWGGLMLLVVPGIIFSLWFALTVPAIIAEDLRATGGMSRSKALASGNLGKIFSVSFLILVIAWVITIPFSYGGAFLSQFVFGGNPMMRTVVSQFIQMVGNILAMPIGASAFILLYYDLRIRKEGFDLEMLAQTMQVQQEGVDGVGSLQ